MLCKARLKIYTKRIIRIVIIGHFNASDLRSGLGGRAPVPLKFVDNGLLDCSILLIRGATKHKSGCLLSVIISV